MINLSKLKARLTTGLRAVSNTPLPEFLFLAGFILGRWWKNSDFQFPHEILLPLALLSLPAALAYYIFRYLLGSALPAHIAALGLSYGIYSYQQLSQIGPFKYLVDSLDGLTAFGRSLVVLVVMAAVSGLVAKLIALASNRYEIVRQLELLKVILFAIGFIFIVQFVRAADRYLDSREELGYRYESPALKATGPSVAKPNIYYLVFDRYTSATELKNNYHFDNSDMMDYLAGQGFVNRNPAYAPYPFTMSSISATLAMDYLPEFRQRFDDQGWQSAFPYRQILSDPPVVGVLRQNGYSYSHISSWWDFTRVGIKADSEPSKSFRFSLLGWEYYASDLERDIINRSLLAPWLQKGVTIGSSKVVKYDLDRNPKQNFDSQLDALTKIAARPDKTNPQFVFAHILAPHPPYVFNADGRPPTYDQEGNDNGVDERVKYINELRYLNQRIKGLVGLIRAQDPDAVVILQADEGPYPKKFRGPMSPKSFYDPAKLTNEELSQKMAILSSYLLPGDIKPTEPNSLTSVNIFRTVLNTYLGYDLPLLPECHFTAGNKYQIYNYEEVSLRLTGRQDPGCSQYR